MAGHKEAAKPLPWTDVCRLRTFLDFGFVGAKDVFCVLERTFPESHRVSGHTQRWPIYDH